MIAARPVSVREIELQARGRCEALVRECLPGAVQDGHYLKAGSLDGARGNSLVVNLAGANRGMWRDWSADARSAEGAGDMICLVEMTKFAGDRGKAVAWLKSWLGLDHLDPARLQTIRAEAAAVDADAAAREEREAEAKRRGAQALWLRGTASIHGTPAAAYLAARGIAPPRSRDGAAEHWPGALRYHDEVWNGDAGNKLPAMLAQMILPDGRHVATHRTWLGREPGTRQWIKADRADLGVPRGQAKKMLGKSAGAFVPLRKGGSGQSMGAMRRPETIYVTEGIEDALTVALAMPAARVIAAYSLGNLGAIAFPALIETIVIVADRDEGEREQQALERAIARQQARGHRVQLVLPPVGVKDLNDWLLQGIAA